MTIATIPEKLRIPPLPRAWIDRPRLHRVWEERSRKPLLLVTAGAGYGKSSFLASEALRDQESVLWLSLDEGDAEFTSFAAHLLALVGRPLDGSAEPEGARFALAALNAALRARERTILILDDAQHLAGSDPHLRFLEALARYLPPRVTLVLSSREPLGIATMRSRSQGRVAAIEARDLVFDAEEIAEFFARRLAGSRPTARQTKRILAATEGWAAGLEIFLQDLETTGEAEIDPALDRLPEIGHGWFDYFAEEVFRKLDAPTRSFLIQTAILPRPSAAACDSLLGRPGGREILSRLAERNLFTLRIDEATAGFRYHALFRSFLLSRAASAFTPAESLRLRRRAVESLIASGEIADAAEIVLEIADPKVAVSFLARHGDPMLQAGLFETLRRLIAFVPAATMRARPRVLFLNGRILDRLGRWDEAIAAYKQVLLHAPDAATRVEVCGILAQIAARRGDYPLARSWCRKGLLAVRGVRAPGHARLLGILGVASCEMGELDEGEADLEKARAVCIRRGDSSGQAQFDFLLTANVHLPRGEIAAGRERALRALARFRSSDEPVRTCQCLWVLGLTSIMAGDVDGARGLAGEGVRIAEHLGYEHGQSMNTYNLGRCAFLDGDRRQARSLLERARDLGDQLGDFDSKILPRILLGECLAHDGNKEAARAVASEARSLARATRDPLQEAQALVTLGLIERQADPAAAVKLLRSAERLLRRIGARYDLNRVILLRLSSERLADDARETLLREMLGSAQRLSHEAIFTQVEPAAAATILAEAVRRDIETEYATRLLAALGERALPSLAELARDKDDAVRARAVDLLSETRGPAGRKVLRRVAGDAPERDSARKAREELSRVPPRPLHVETLGGFRVRTGDVEIPASAWRSGRARRLFQFLLVHRFRWVGGDEILEGLWPEADPDKARGNLWQAVFHLRKALEPDAGDARGSCYLRVAESRYRLEPGEGFSYDAIAFEEGIRRADQQARRGRRGEALRTLEEQMERYRDGFLPESPYDEFLVAERERLRDLFLRACLRYVEMASSARLWADCIPACRRALREDPYQEEHYYHLIQAQVRLGNRKEALESYRRFEETIVAELGGGIPARMQDLARALRPG